MNIFDALRKGDFASPLQSLQGRAQDAARPAQEKSGGSLLGAGALGALLGLVLPGGFMKNAALLGAGAVAWNFYKKWSAEKEQGGREDEAPRPAAAIEPAKDPAAMLMLRAMIYAARADGHIDEAERSRICKLCGQFFPGRDVNSLVGSIVDEPLNPDLLARQTRSSEQREDLYRLSCLVLDIDHFMERGYLDHLASSLGIGKSRQGELEAEAEAAKRSLDAAN